MTATRRRDARLCALALAMMAALVVVHLFAPDIAWLRRLELATLDTRIRLRGPLPPGPEIVIVMIDDRTIADFGRWPMQREKIAELVALLDAAGARAIGIDVLFTEATRKDDTQRASLAQNNESTDVLLARQFRASGDVVLPFTFKFRGPNEGAAPPSVARAAYVLVHDTGDFRPVHLDPTGLVTPVNTLADSAALGHVLVAYDVDGAPRFDYPALAYDLDYYPSMALRVAQLYLGVPWDKVSLQLGRGIALGPVFVPTDAQMRFLINYLGPTRTFPTYSLSQVLAGEVPAGTFAQRIVLVGANALGTGDTFKTPFTASMPGVERLATSIDAIIHERNLRRPAGMLWLEIAGMLAAALAMGLSMSRWSLLAATLTGAGVVAAMAVSGQWALARFSVWQASAVPILAALITFTALLFYRYLLLDKERRHIRHAFARYLAPHMVDRLANEQQLPQLGGEQRELTVLFCDLRGFTALTERLEPAALTRLANAFFAVATQAILEHGGTVDKYIGDAIMAFWNAPIETPEHAELACRAALRILEQMRVLNAALAQESGMPTLAVGIGVNTGTCTVGNFGSSRRFDYSAIGDAVNVAARLESETKEQGSAILIGPLTAARVESFAVLGLGETHLRGRTTAVEIHALVGDEKMRASPQFAELLALHAQWQAYVNAGDTGNARRLAQDLTRQAPLAIRPLYEAFLARTEPSA